MFFQKKALNNVDPSMCNPIIVNQTNQSIVLFMDRGVLYNKQVLAPGEAVGMTRRETAGMVVPYKIHAVVGDEKSLPTRSQSVRNLLSTAVIPTAFLVGTFMAASSAGTLTGPSSALTRVASGVVIRGMVIDSAALAAGSLAANRAAVLADKLIEKYPQNFSAKSGHYMPGNRYVIIRGGIDEPLTITTITEKKFRQIPIVGDVKVPMDTLQDKIEYYTPSILRSSSTKTPLLKQDGEEATSSSAEVQQQQRADVSKSQRAPQIQQQQQQQQQQDASSEDEEERQMRQAIEESLRMEEDRKKQEEEYNKRLLNDKRPPVVLF